MAYAQCIDGHSGHVYDQQTQSPGICLCQIMVVTDRYENLSSEKLAVETFQAAGYWTDVQKFAFGVLIIAWFGVQGRLPAPPAAPRLAVLGSTLAAVGAMRPALARLVHLAATPAQQASDAIP